MKSDPSKTPSDKQPDSEASRGGFYAGMKWAGLASCLVLLAGWTYSTRSAATYTTEGSRTQWGLMLGSIMYGWRTDGWSIEQEKYPATPGLEHGAEYGGNPDLTWWSELGHLKTWTWIGIPLWIPFILAGVPTTLLWAWNRRATLS